MQQARHLWTGGTGCPTLFLSQTGWRRFSQEKTKTVRILFGNRTGVKPTVEITLILVCQLAKPRVYEWSYVKTVTCAQEVANNDVFKSIGLEHVSKTDP